MKSGREGSVCDDEVRDELGVVGGKGVDEVRNDDSGSGEVGDEELVEGGLRIKSIAS